MNDYVIKKTKWYFYVEIEMLWKMIAIIVDVVIF
jgi:hypothetical protein